MALSAVSAVLRRTAPGGASRIAAVAGTRSFRATPNPAAKKGQPSAAELSSIIEAKIMDYGGKVELEEIGKVLAIGDGIARVHGLQQVQAGEMVEFDSGLRHGAQPGERQRRCRGLR
jgi:hypothetical protein